jgi:hypothetical protein
LEGLLISYNAKGSDTALVTDFYGFAMAAAYFYSYDHTNFLKVKGIFEMFVRRLQKIDHIWLLLVLSKYFTDYGKKIGL